MQDAQYWMQEFWAGLSLIDLLGGALLGTLLGLALGIATWMVLRRCNWLLRQRRWHHALIACHVVVLPLLFAFSGLQVGAAAGAQRALYKQMDHFQPHLQTLVSTWQMDFEKSLDNESLAALMRSDASVHEITRNVVGAYLVDYPLPGAALLQGDNWAARMASRGLAQLRARLMTQWVEESLSEELANYTGVSQAVYNEALGMRMNELVHSQGAIRLLKTQLSAMMPSVYLGLLLPALIGLALVLLEIALSHYFGWCRQVTPVAV
ncbi:MAG: hypothetical protein ACREP4_13465 [Stenotrophomonas sp.]|uniref:hypothetical protein n=1 Tax=Stenotrophomonas sp. TaxID=69392 RepID=UPI003D6D17D4